jgi:hypothetical protein
LKYNGQRAAASEVNEMNITRQSKLAFLFFSKENPIWEKFLRHTPTQAEISTHTGIQQSTLSNWRHGGKIDLKTITEAFDKLRKFINLADPPLAEVVQRFSEEFTVAATNPGSSRRVYDVARKTLGMTIEQSQTIIDEVIYDKFGMFPTMHYHSAGDAYEQFGRFVGNYFLWVRRSVDGEWKWLKVPLRVRYVLKLKGGAAIRCKLNAPILSPSLPAVLTHLEYDGFLRTRANKLFWTFEKREDLGSSDFFYAITDQGRVIDDRLTLVGTYLTIGQDAENSILTNTVLLQRLTIEDVKAEMTKRIGFGSSSDKNDQSGGGSGEDRNSRDAQTIREWMSSTAEEKFADGEEQLYIEGLWKRIQVSHEVPDVRG